MSASSVSRLKKVWEDEQESWGKRRLVGKRYVYVWADGVYCSARMEDARLCILGLIGATEDGTKELIAIEDGYRESEQSWLEVLRGLQARGLEIEPKLAIGDGSLDFWKALAKVYGNTKRQRCWVHKTANILNMMPKSVQPKAKEALHEIWMASWRKDAEEAFDHFVLTYLRIPMKVATDSNATRPPIPTPSGHFLFRSLDSLRTWRSTGGVKVAKRRACEELGAEGEP